MKKKSSTHRKEMEGKKFTVSWNCFYNRIHCCAQVVEFVEQLVNSVVLASWTIWCMWATKGPIFNQVQIHCIWKPVGLLNYRLLLLRLYYYHRLFFSSALCLFQAEQRFLSSYRQPNFFFKIVRASRFSSTVNCLPILDTKRLLCVLTHFRHP